MKFKFNIWKKEGIILQLEISCTNGRLLESWVWPKEEFAEILMIKQTNKQKHPNKLAVTIKAAWDSLKQQHLELGEGGIPLASHLLTFLL